VCAAVYAELLAGPGATVAALDAFLDGTGIAIDDALPLALWREAGLAYRAYAQRRLKATALLTLHRGDFARGFPSLPLIVPNLKLLPQTQAQFACSER